jgi:CRISPR-associated protein Cas2
MMQEYLITYDVSEDSVRNRLSNRLKDFGLQRIERSVFIGELSPEETAEIQAEIRKIAGDDVVHFFPVCKECYAKIKTIGNAFLPQKHDNIVL